MDDRLLTPCFAVPFEGRYVVYFPLRRAAFLASAGAVNFLSRLQKEAPRRVSRDEAALLDLLDGLGVLGPGPEKSPSSPDFASLLKPTRLALLLTTRCNLDCVYCYAKAGVGREDMPPALAEAAVDFVANNAAKRGVERLDLAFHGGGEPFLLWETFTRAVARAESFGLSVAVRAATNGNFSAEKRRFVLDHFAGLALSLDGPPEIHDRLRPGKRGGKSSDRVLRNVRALAAAGFPYMIRTTLTRNTVKSLPRIIRYFKEFGIDRPVLVEPAYGMGRNREGDQCVPAEDFVAAFREAEKEAGAEGPKLFFSPARLGLVHNRYCGSSSGNFCVTPGGAVTACYQVFSPRLPDAEPYLTGRFDPASGNFSLNEKKLTALSQRTADSIPFCRDCFARWHCAGDCPRMALPGGSPNPERCQATRALLLDQILAKIAQSGGAFWKGRE